MRRKAFLVIWVLAFCGSLAAAQLRLVTPHGGESWRAGTAIDITWEQKDLKGDVQIVLYKEGRYYANIGKVPVAPGRYSWRVPYGMPPAGDYSLRIYQGRLSAVPARPFSLRDGAQAAPVAATAGEAYVPELPDELVAERTRDANGDEIMVVRIAGRPPHDFHAPDAVFSASAVTLSNMPAFDWSFGCSATSAAMIAGYYDLHGYPNMYKGPTNGGYMPLNNSSWGTVTINGEERSQCPLSATRKGVDGRTIRGHVDDFWRKYGDKGSDPYIVGGWTMHAYGECTGDYMKTNQSAWGNSDGSTLFWYRPDGRPYDVDNSNDGGYGFELFMKSRGYSVTARYTQLIPGYAGNSRGFTFAQYKAEIDAHRPVIIQVEGHTMVGYGYDTAGNKIYIRDTWDYNSHQMTWGGSYAGMRQWGVVVLNLAPAPGLTLTMAATSGGTTLPPPGSHAYASGEKVTLTAIPNSNYEFVDWSGSLTGKTNPVTITMDANKSIKATFRVKPWLYMSSSVGGTTLPAAGYHYYLTGTVVSVTPVPSPYYVFKFWSGSAGGAAVPLSVTMSANKSIMANFKKVLAPLSAAGQKVENRSFSQREIIGILTWQANPGNTGLAVEKYLIYRVGNGSRTLLGEVAASGPLSYSHRQAGEGQLQYEIAAVVGGREGVPAGVTIN